MSRSKRQSRIIRRDVHGILLLDKPLDMSSNQALQRVRFLFRAKKAGHTGSLDPLASGMLPICFGDATRFSQVMLDANKTYEATASLGRCSTTGDAEGDKSPPVAVPEMNLAEWQAVADRFVGVIEQVPPMYSALKQDGKRLYELARSGHVVDRPSRKVTIHELSVLGVGNDRLDIRVTCSKGTYIRTLIEDLAQAAGTLAWTAALRRTRVAPFMPPMFGLSEIETAVETGRADALMLGADAGIRRWPAVQLDQPAAARFLNGQKQPCTVSDDAHMPDSCEDILVRCYRRDGLFLGSGRMSSGGETVKPERVMRFAQEHVSG